jgi:predicted nucleic acid-binding protein
VSTIILDTSVAIPLVVDEPGSGAAARAVVGLEILVPDVFWGEVSAALVRKVRLRLRSRDDAFAAYGLLRRLVEYTVASEPLGAIAIALSLDLEHPVYDCLFLAAAIAHQAPLLTADSALCAKAVEAGLGEHIRLVG